MEKKNLRTVFISMVASAIFVFVTIVNSGPLGFCEIIKNYAGKFGEICAYVLLAWLLWLPVSFLTRVCRRKGKTPQSSASSEEQKIACPQCGESLCLPQAYLGQRGECPACGHKFILEKQLSPQKQTSSLVLALATIIVTIVIMTTIMLVVYPPGNVHPKEKVSSLNEQTKPPKPKQVPKKSKVEPNVVYSPMYNPTPKERTLTREEMMKITGRGSAEFGGYQGDTFSGRIYNGNNNIRIVELVIGLAQQSGKEKTYRNYSCEVYVPPLETSTFKFGFIPGDEERKPNYKWTIQSARGIDVDAKPLPKGSTVYIKSVDDLTDEELERIANGEDYHTVLADRLRKAASSQTTSAPSATDPSSSVSHD